MIDRRGNRRQDDPQGLQVRTVIGASEDSLDALDVDVNEAGADHQVLQRIGAPKRERTA